MKLLETRLGIYKDPTNNSGRVSNAPGSSQISSTAYISSTAIHGGKLRRQGSVISSQLIESRKRENSTGEEENPEDDDFWETNDETSPTIGGTNSNKVKTRLGPGNRPNSKTNVSANIPPAVKRDLEEQLAETLYKRAQAKMMLPSSENSVIESALSDVWKVM